MNLTAFEKLWNRSGGHIPHLDLPGYETVRLLSTMVEHDSKLRFWGVVAHHARYRGHTLLHCYNFGNVSVQYPWQAQLQNFGHTIPVTVVRGGTYRRQAIHRSLLSHVQQPYLVLGYEAPAAATEHLQPGMLVTLPEAPPQQRQYRIAFPHGTPDFGSSGLLYYYLMKRVPFAAEPAGLWLPPGAPAGLPSISVTLRQPVIMEPGWPVLLLEKNRWVWGVVCE